ncbi:hypothetical protein MKK65_29300 [Methylobacterium sp. J-001]|uniref:tetratricopeptide repeat protein n=1 Tax=Methylobacterium sp. J-001 TaxID=2836609 RepID=UPI001FBA674D|nr:hypothetical protein [Methylobacterium sp. J-001]MCJ2120613.1 hypothetical protein [Methylobacterium sp. J-001]
MYSLTDAACRDSFSILNGPPGTQSALFQRRAIAGKAADKMIAKEYYKSIENLIALSNLSGAEERLQEAFVKFPEDPFLWQFAGWVAEKQEDWVSAEQRWGKVCSLFPNDPKWLQLHVQALRRLGRSGDADALLPVIPQDYYKTIENLLAQSDLSRVEDVISDALAAFPEDPYLWQWAGWSSERRKDWVSAEERWRKVRSLFADDPHWLGLHVQALRRLGRAAEADATLLERHDVEQDPRLSIERVKTDFALAAGDTLRKIESLGSGCELGVLQREVGHEPLGLLRWTYIKPEGLLKALKMEFAGVGEISQSQLGRLTSQSEDYWFSDREYTLGRHTFASVEKEPSGVLTGMCRQIKILKRKLLEDLREGEKIFLYKWTDTSHSEVENTIIQIHDALQEYASNPLIFVSRSDGVNAPGSVRKIYDTLLYGYIAHTAAFDGVTESDFESWRNIIANANREFISR